MMIILTIIELTQGHPKQKHTLACQLSCIVGLLGRLSSSCRRTGSFKTIAFSKVKFLKTVSKMKGLTTNVDLRLYISLQALHDSII